MTTRDESYQGWLDAFHQETNVNPDLKDALNHGYNCRCALCLAWWAQEGPDPELGGYGPFSEEEVRRAREARR